MRSASTAGGLNNRNPLLFNTAFGGTKEKETSFAVAGNGAKDFTICGLSGNICG